jgi:hypothetical protein
MGLLSCCLCAGTSLLSPDPEFDGCPLTNLYGFIGRWRMRCSSSLSYTLLPITSSKSDAVECSLQMANSPKFLQHREGQNPPRKCYPDSLYPSRRNHRPCHASMHDAYVYHFPPSYSTAVLRDFLVHAPPVRSFSAGPLHTCNWLLRARHSRTNLPICGEEILEPLPWL